MTEPKISIRNLYKVFGPRPQDVLSKVKDGMGKTELLKDHGHALGLNNINVDMAPGEITVIMGLSGSGKSTLIRHLNRLIEPTSGEVIVSGEDILTYNAAQLRDMRRKCMSMVFQKFALLPHRTVLENAATALIIDGLPQAEWEPEATRWLERVGLSGQGGQYPHQLSGGMQQRVGIARALTSNSDIMLMDEAFSALDPLIRTDMQDLLLELQKELNKTIVFITHDLDEALKLADHLVILKDGQVIQQGEPQHILINPNDPYIMDFIADINRARVLRAGTVMTKGGDTTGLSHEADASATLEDLIAASDGNTNVTFIVTSHGENVGTLSMTDVVKSLVPAHTEVVADFRTSR
ncbi:glycine betaine/L-proline ABC transporter ATP-binding protein [Loktanella sp. D2R18]|uniref:quaternary amine ABC transporter ATP-binding protein n=1 Tax=Rhodobacterales TaxID=204455 RepID=UPI000DE8131F|nr:MULTISPECIES: betaine/proline/choline family ABC transporter ATP-binding protein [Rhodobacterales]MDO6591106.1 betaine/proline/choline family ABC transporter ATP-binding protein [Yoonia sp. 1_MG-2023]RBW42385.1 glycine betaine/L-proline ABC transporter ATP-binding protein [Loktanella sp. D2R18]